MQEPVEEVEVYMLSLTHQVVFLVEEEVVLEVLLAARMVYPDQQILVAVEVVVGILLIQPLS